MLTVFDVVMENLKGSPEFEKIQHFVQTVDAGMKAVNEVMREFEPHIKSLLILVDRVDKLPNYYKAALCSLANHEWYPDDTGMYLEDILALGEATENDTEYCNLRLINHFRSRTNALEKDLIESNPDRVHVLREGFNNHREGRYYSSVPIFLSQADGIFSKSYNVSPFREGMKGRKGIQKDPRLDEICRFLFSINTLPIWINDTKRPSSFAGFNRHQVLHGESVSYGTEENSLKAISFLSFINTLSEDLPLPATAPAAMP